MRMLTCVFCGKVVARNKSLVVRLAKLKIDSAQSDSKAALNSRNEDEEMNLNAYQ
jgi:hypothetical protein